MSDAMTRRGRTAVALSLALALPMGLAVGGCSNMNATQQRALTGTVGGAGVGAVLGAIGGNAGLGAAAGAAAGLAGGLIYDQVKKNEAASYQQGYAAGKQSSQ
ncbi:MAG: hypothetical protein JSR21_16840 [Proteobacteria bacterium]|nr:hypothetical protein [Pseudomonadota bacterium]